MKSWHCAILIGIIIVALLLVLPYLPPNVAVPVSVTGMARNVPPNSYPIANVAIIVHTGDAWSTFVTDGSGRTSAIPMMEGERYTIEVRWSDQSKTEVLTCPTGAAALVVIIDVNVNRIEGYC